MSGAEREQLHAEIQQLQAELEAMRLQQARQAAAASPQAAAPAAAGSGDVGGTAAEVARLQEQLERLKATLVPSRQRPRHRGLVSGPADGAKIWDAFPGTGRRDQQSDLAGRSLETRPVFWSSKWDRKPPQILGQKQRWVTLSELQSPCLLWETRPPLRAQNHRPLLIPHCPQ